MFTNQLDRQDRLRSKPYFNGAPGMNRTCDLRFRKPMFYPLNYRGLNSNTTFTLQPL